MLTFLFKPTNNCNLRCRYCFIENGKKDTVSSMMSLEDAYVAFDKIVQFVKSVGGNSCRILWHGGEPLMWGLKNYTALFEHLQENYPDFKFEHSMQSNITLLNKPFLELFTKYGCDVSTSMDGYAELHDYNRIQKNGKGSFDLVKEKFLLAKSMDVHIGAVVVVSKKNINHFVEIYEFFKELGIGFRLNPLSLIGEAKNNDGQGITPVAFADALIELFDYWIKDDDAVRISNFVEIASNLSTGVTSSCGFSPNCQRSLTTIEPNGDVTPCDRFVGVERFVYGNIFTGDLREIMDKKYNDFQDRTKNLKKSTCADCDLWDICNGGCPSDAYYTYNDINYKSTECECLKKLANHIKTKLGKDIMDH